ncbi:MAG: hypothetical protein RJB38_1217, partial [Pseudomonadota bacterium]
MSESIKMTTAQALESAPPPAPSKEPEKIGQILIKHTSLTQEQLNEALRIQSAEGGLLGEILVRKNLVVPHELMRALCTQLGLRFIEELKPNDIDVKLIQDIPINYAKSKEVIPIALENDVL